MRFPGARELGWIQTTGGKSPYNQTALPDYRDLARENRTFEAITAEARRPLSLRTDGAAEQVWALLVSGNYLTTLRARPLLGRLITEADATGAEPAVVVQRAFLERAAGRRPDRRAHVAAERAVVLDRRSDPRGIPGTRRSLRAGPVAPSRSTRSARTLAGADLPQRGVAEPGRPPEAGGHGGAGTGRSPRHHDPAGAGASADQRRPQRELLPAERGRARAPHGGACRRGSRWRWSGSCS